MAKVVATLCFLLTLLCPVFCLADGDGDDNCEAMTIGAVVAKSETAPSLVGILDAAIVADLPAAPRPCSTLVVWNHSHTSPPPASVRRACLQVFLF